MYQFRGASDTSYRPSYNQESRSPPRYSNYAPGISPPRGPASDSYRPRDPPSDFNFRYDAPPSLDFRQASNRQRSPPRQRIHRQEGNGGHRQDNHGNNNRSTMRGGYRGRAGPRMASDREFLKGNRAPTPELMPGMDDDQGNAVKYVPIEDLSDSDEAEMDLSDEEGADTDQQPKKKQAKIETLAADGDSVPKWSNPDPYTALPPPDESQRKKKDVVKLIRKARVTASSENTTKTDAVADDFISFDFDDDDQDDDSMLVQKPGNGVVGAPTGPRLSHRDNAHKQDQQSGSLNQVLKRQEQVSRPVLQGQPNDHPSVPSTKLVHADISQTKLPNKPVAQVIDFTSDPALGSRKRTIRDEIKGPLNSPPLIHESSRGKKPPVNGEILKAWRVKDGISPTPWLSIDHSDSANMGVW
jgi:non-canonical poly(A) RNA polymerase PAPD5/7